MRNLTADIEAASVRSKSLEKEALDLMPPLLQLLAALLHAKAEVYEQQTAFDDVKPEVNQVRNDEICGR